MKESVAERMRADGVEPLTEEQAARLPPLFRVIRRHLGELHEATDEAARDEPEVSKNDHERLHAFSSVLIAAMLVSLTNGLSKDELIALDEILKGDKLEEAQFKHVKK